MNRGELRAAVRDRLAVPSTDGLLTDTSVNGFVQAALRFIETDRDWPWLTTTATFPTVAGTGTYAQSAFTAAANDWSHSVTLRLVDDYGTYLRRASLEELDEGVNLAANGRPQGWTVDDGKIVLRPVPDAVYSLIHRYQKTEADLSVDGTSPVLPSRFHDAVVEYATYLAARKVGEEAKAAIARTEYEAWRQRMLDDRRRNASPPRVRLRQWA